MMDWIVRSSMWILHLFDGWTAKANAVCICVLVVDLYMLYLVVSKGALFARDNGDGTETEYYLFGKRTVKIEDDEE